MSDYYEVWDYETRNQINTFATEEAARAFLQRLLDLNGPDGIRELAIIRQVPDAIGDYEATLIAEGADLVRHGAELLAAPEGRQSQSGETSLEEQTAPRRAAS